MNNPKKSGADSVEDLQRASDVPPEGEARAVLVLCDTEWSDEIESRFLDSEQGAQVLSAEEAEVLEKRVRAVAARLLGRKT